MTPVTTKLEKIGRWPLNRYQEKLKVLNFLKKRDEVDTQTIASALDMSYHTAYAALQELRCELKIHRTKENRRWIWHFNRAFSLPKGRGLNLPKDETRQATLRAVLHEPSFWASGKMKGDWVELCGVRSPMLELLHPYLGEHAKFVGIDRDPTVIYDNESYWQTRGFEHTEWVRTEMSAWLAKQKFRPSVSPIVLVFDSTSRPVKVQPLLNSLFEYAQRQAQIHGSFLLVVNTCINGVTVDDVEAYRQDFMSRLTGFEEGLWYQYRSHAGSPTGMLLARVMFRDDGSRFGLGPISSEYSSMILPLEDTSSRRVLNELHAKGALASHDILAVPLTSRPSCLAFLHRTNLVQLVNGKYDLTPQARALYGTSPQTLQEKLEALYEKFLAAQEREGSSDDLIQMYNDASAMLVAHPERSLDQVFAL